MHVDERARQCDGWLAEVVLRHIAQTNLALEQARNTYVADRRWSRRALFLKGRHCAPALQGSGSLSGGQAVLARKQIDAAIELLCARFPACFVMLQYRRRPLKVGINADLVAALGEEVDRRLLGAALRDYTRNLHYRLAQKPGVARIDLDGKPVGEVSEADAAHAAADVAAHRAAAIRKRQENYRKPALPEPAPATAAPAPEPEPALAAPAPPKRLGLADLREAAAARRQREAGA